MRKLMLLALALMVTFVTVPAFASVQSIKISGSVDTTYIYRANLDLGFNVDTAAGSNVSDETQNDFITQTFINLDADMTDQTSGHITLGHEQAWGEDSSTNGAGSMDVVEAYLKIREMLYSPLTVVIGRQSFSYGNSFIFDSAGRNNAAPAESGINGVANDLTKQTTLDAVRAMFNYDPLMVEIFYTLVTNGNTGITDDDNSGDDDVFGINATHNLGDDMDTQVEAYFFSRRNRTESDADAQEDTIHILGTRASANVLEGLAVQLEVAHQSGSDNIGGTRETASRNANAVQAIAAWQVPSFAGGMDEMNPVLQYAFSWFEGQGDTGNNTEAEVEQEGWDPFFENQGGGKIYNTLFEYTNSFIHEVALTVTPMEDVSATLSWTGIWLDKEIAESGTLGLLSPGGAAVASVVVNNTETHIGNEFDLVTTYDYTEDVQFGLNLGWFLPGDVFSGGNQDSAMQVLANANLSF
jgi:hypothetical protein